MNRSRTRSLALGALLFALLISGGAHAEASPGASCPGAEVDFHLDLRLEGFYETGLPTAAPGLLYGLHLGPSFWFNQGLVELIVEAGVESGVLFPREPEVPLLLSLEVGPGFLIGGTRKLGTILSIAWSPRLLYDFGNGGQTFAPFGLEAAAQFGFLKLPIWFSESLAGSWMTGVGVGFAF